MKIFSYEILQNLIREEFLVEFDLKLEKSSFSRPFKTYLKFRN